MSEYEIRAETTGGRVIVLRGVIAFVLGVVCGWLAGRGVIDLIEESEVSK
jgi:uncharacterized membrane protein (DUF441 family)